MPDDFEYWVIGKLTLDSREKEALKKFRRFVANNPNTASDLGADVMLRLFDKLNRED